MNEACKKIKDKIEASSGTFKLKQEPFVVGKNQEKELAAKLMEIDLEEEGEEFEFAE